MTLYFQVKFLKLKFPEHAKSAIKNALKLRKKSIITEKYQKKCKELKRDTETQSQDDSIEKGNIKKILNKKKNMKKRIIRKILSQKKNIKKRNIKKTLNEQENMKKKC